jgi:hypothetical protein
MEPSRIPVEYGILGSKLSDYIAERLFCATEGRREKIFSKKSGMVALHKKTYLIVRGVWDQQWATRNS